jgi:hypothetical protein
LRVGFGEWVVEFPQLRCSFRADAGAFAVGVFGSKRKDKEKIKIDM